MDIDDKNATDNKDDLPRQGFSRPRHPAEQVPDQDGRNRSRAAPAESNALIHELQIHQIELEMQNEALRQIQGQLEQSRDQYRRLFHSAPVGYFILDKNGTILEANETGATLLGLERESLPRRRFHEFIARKDQDTFYHHRKAVPASRDPLRCEVEIIRKDGNPIFAQLTSIACGETGSDRTMIGEIPFRWQMAVTDCTQRKEQERALLQAKEKAEEADRAKGAFLANVSHEIRSPLNAVIGLTDFMLTSNLPREEERNNQRIVLNAALGLLDLVNNLVDMSKIESGSLIPEKVPFDLRSRIEDLFETKSLEATQKGLRLYLDMASDLPKTIIGDPLRLHQILMNLVSNALKFTEKGLILISVERARMTSPADADSVELHFSVTDTGIGIPADKLELIFNTFTQVDDSTCRKYGGSGLGLSICKHLVEKMGGQIRVESQVGIGSTFHFTLRAGTNCPVPALADGDPAPREGSLSHLSLEGRGILLGDGQVLGRLITRDILLGFGARVEEANSTATLLAKLDEAQRTNHPWDLLILDESLLWEGVGQPEKLEGHAGHDGPVLVLLNSLTATNIPRHGWLEKARTLKTPMRRSAFLKAINRAMGRIPHSPDPMPPREPERSPPLRILLVEDLLSNQQVASQILQGAGHFVTIANHGQEALDRLRDRKERFDLVLMDLQMPVMNGFETTRRIRQSSRTEIDEPNIPIIALTANALLSEEQKCREIGMNGFVRKPFRSIDLLNALSPVIGIKPPLPRGEILKPVEGDAETLAQAKQAFLSEGMALVAKLHTAMETHGVSQTIQAVQALRSALLAIGATRAASQALKLKGNAELGDWEAALANQGAIERLVRETISMLKPSE
ncbi:MAG: response regulator [Magnetococcales bacterium]|nr:response regulator [Magnetococcales bacterium]